MNIVHTAGHEIGQIYVPLVNWLLAFGTLTAVVGFGSSAALAGAFGIAVPLLMAITTLMATFVALQWKHNAVLVYAVNGSLLALDLLFGASTSTKLFDGGWFPLVISFIIAFLMLTWRKGQEIMDQIRLEIREKSQEFIPRMKVDPPYSIPGTAVVLGRMKQGVPLPLTLNVNFNHVLHERVLLVAVEMTETPRVRDEDRVTVTPLSECVSRVELKFGFMEKADVQGHPSGCGPRADRIVQPGAGYVLCGSRDHHSHARTIRNGTVAKSNIRANASQCAAARRLF